MAAERKAVSSKLKLVFSYNDENDNLCEKSLEEKVMRAKIPAEQWRTQMTLEQEMYFIKKHAREEARPEVGLPGTDETQPRDSMPSGDEEEVNPIRVNDDFIILKDLPEVPMSGDAINDIPTLTIEKPPYSLFAPNS